MRESLSPLFAFDGVAPDKRVGEGVLSPNEPRKFSQYEKLIARLGARLAADLDEYNSSTEFRIEFSGLPSQSDSVATTELDGKMLTLQGGEMVWTDVDPPFHPTPANSHLHTDDCPFGPCDTGVTITTSSADTVCWDYAISGNGSDCTAITYHDSDRWRPGVEPRLIAVGSLEAMAKRFKMGEGMSVTLRPDGQYELTE